ncbi:hypothetical protein G7054_g4689 [Neopestalotiopsis clavispora]|nr:hypothetical protein G7054_g4689 [Neopestalotiopsis clavispora]
MAPEPILPTSNETSATASVDSGSPTRATTKPGLVERFRLHDEINIHYADIPVCLCSLTSGLCDSVAFNASSVFVSMQTGNTVFLALGTAGLPANVPLLWLKSLCSIAAFMAGVFVFGQTRHVRPTSKLTLAANFLAQSIFIFAAAALAQGGVAPAFSLLSVAGAFGGQICSSRILGFNEVPTNVLTSVYCDLFNDPNLLAPWKANKKRNRRASAVVLMLVGAIIGGWLARSGAGMSTALWIAGAIKFGIATAWLLWKPKSAAPSAEKK